MRTLKTLLVLVLVIVAGACSGRGRVNTTPIQPAPATTGDTANETLEQRVARLKAEEFGRLVASPGEQAVRERAEKIAREKLVVEARKDLRKIDTPEMREARKQLADEAKRHASVRRNEVRVQARAAITGCEPGTVAVDSRAVQSNWLDVMVQVRIVNATNLTYDVQTPFRNIGTAVRGLCPGGSSTLSFVRNMFADGLSEEVVLVAVSQSVAGGVVTEERRFYLNASNVQYRRVESQIWTLSRRQ